MSGFDALFYPLADALAMDLVYQVKFNRIGGTREKKVEWVEGMKLAVKATVTDSMVDDLVGTVGVIVHFGGNVYLLMLHEENKDLLEAFVLDGSVLGLVPEKKTSNLLPREWSRKALYSRIQPAVRATFIRDTLEDNWIEVENGGKLLKQYVDLRKDGKTASEARTILKSDLL